MSALKIILIKYVYIDVVAYTQRSIEAQCDIITTLNKIVKEVLAGLRVNRSSVIYIPVGDGICIALDGTTLAYDIHIDIAKNILSAIWTHNQSLEDNSRKFEVRIGINQSEDNLIHDINNSLNVAGAGINNARRIMDLADGSQILVSRAVYDILYPREKYLKAFRRFSATVKHGVVLDVYQLVDEGVTSLNVNPPSILASTPMPEPKLSKLAAYYFAHCIKNREFIISNRGHGQNNYALAVLLWYLAVDSVGKSESTLAEPYEAHMPETRDNTLDEQFELFMSLPFSVCADLQDLVCESKIGSENYKYFEDRYECTLVNTAGQQKLKSEWPEIWSEFSLGELRD